MSLLRVGLAGRRYFRRWRQFLFPLRKRQDQATPCVAQGAGSPPGVMVALDGYVYMVPFVEEPDFYFLKTIIPSRKATRDYLLRSKPNETP